MSPLLKHLYLSNISTLVELPSSFQNLHQLSFLDIKNCENLETLPTGINLQSLRKLDLSGCSKLRTFPDISTNIGRLYLKNTGIEEVPWWIEKFYYLEFLDMKGSNKLEYVNLNISKLKQLERVDLSECEALTGASWSDRSTSVVSYFERHNISISFNNLDQEALIQQKTYLGCKLNLSGEKVPSYFTHRTIGTSSSSLTIPLPQSSLSQTFLRFTACIVLNCDNTSALFVDFMLRGSFWNSSDSYDQAQDFCADTEYYEIFPCSKDSRLFIFDCQMSQIPLGMNFDHVNMEIHAIDSSDIRVEIKEWGIRIIEENCSSADYRLGYPNTPLPHVFEGNMINEAGEGEESAGEDEVTEPSSNRMPIT